jgi:hypothetical protein
LFSDNEETETLTIIDPKLFPSKASVIKPAQRPLHKLFPSKRLLHIALFHEMLHWYQLLRYHERANETEKGVDCGPNDSPNVQLLLYYYFQNNKLVSEPKLLWGNCFLMDPTDSIRVDEMRVILGSPLNLADFLNGDDLSENLFRCFCEEPLRFGENYDSSNQQYLQAPEFSIKKACEVVEKAAMCYSAL